MKALKKIFLNLTSLIHSRNFGGHILQNADVNPPHKMASQFLDFCIEYWLQGQFSAA